MSRSGYDDCDGDWNEWALICYRGAVASAIRGRRGQAFLYEMLCELALLPARRLIRNELEAHGEVCALGAIGRARGIDMSALDPEDSEQIARVFGIAPALAREIVYENDLGNYTPEERFDRMRSWIEECLTKGRS